MKKVQKTMMVAELKPSPWNPRSETELDAGHSEMIKLIASVRELGVIQPVAVWGDVEPKMVIAGHRRLAAALAVGTIEEIPVFEFTGITEAQAREITRVENEVRFNIDPMRDAELVGSMISLGYDQKEIAAHFGVSEAMICRRVKLLGLLPEIRDIAVKSGNFATHCLEQIALYPVAIQRACLSVVTFNSKRQGSTVRWGDISYCFNRELQDLAEAKFDTKACLKCPMRTGAQPDLWGDLEKGDKLGRCLDGGCFCKKLRERNEARVRDMVGKKKIEIVCADDHDVYINGKDGFSLKPTKKCTVAWWSWNEWNDDIVVRFGPSLADYEKMIADRRAAEKAEADAKAAESESEKAAREAAEAEMKRINDERRKLDQAFDDAANSITDIFGSADNEKILKAVKSKIVGKAFKGKAADYVVDCVANWLKDYDCEIGLTVGVCEAFPAFAKDIKVKPDMLKKFRAAQKALADFDKAHERD